MPMLIGGLQNTVIGHGILILSASMILTSIAGCSVATKTPESISAGQSNKRSFIPIIYPDRVIELNTKTGEERIVPDDDLIVENGKVWGRYLRFGNDVEYTISYYNQLCAPTLTFDIDTIGESSRQIRSFATPAKKYDDCQDQQMTRAVKRINKSQSK